MFIGDDCIGVTTSGGYGHFVQKSLGFGYVDPANSGPGTEFGIDLLGERCRARVLMEPAYDPANERLRS
jgi:dimethylglycine dehydrogenase